MGITDDHYELPSLITLTDEIKNRSNSPLPSPQNYMFANFCVSTILELAIISALNHFGTVNITHLANGCYSYVFALYINYCKDIPKEKFDFFGISFSEKLIVYVLGCQMLFTSYPVLVACLSGLASGLICRSNAFNVCDVFRLPPRLLTIVIRCLNVLLLSNNAPKESLINGATQSDRRQQYMELYEQNLLNGQVPFLPGAENASVASSSGSSGVSTQSGDSIDEQELEQNVIQLQEMGFDSEKAKQILRSNNNDLSRATNLLLEDS